MKIRNNTNKDFQLIFSDGKVINLSRAEISRTLDSNEERDPAVIKAIQNRWIVQYKEPIIENIKIPKVAEKVSQDGEDKKKKGEEEIANRRTKKLKFGQSED